jgi:2-keto-3-deoxy-L-rhamnonate aldolase RhmA
MGKNLKKALLERSMTIGTWIQLGHPGIAEIFANAGFDWIAADCEHTDIDIGPFTAIARGAHGRGADILARVRSNDVMAIRQVLDAGAQGVIVPLVNNAEEAKKAVRSAKFPPEGVRGFAYFRANNWGMDAAEYAKNANKEMIVVVMKEAFKKVADACRRHGRSAGMHIIVPTQEAIIRAVEYGFSFIALGMDTIFLDQSARNVLKQINEIKDRSPEE